MPDLNTNTAGKSGFVVSSSAEQPGFFLFHIFNCCKGDFGAADRSSPMFNQIKGRQLIRLYQFTLRGRSIGENILKWALEASVNGSTWVVLYSTVTIPSSNETQFFAPMRSPPVLSSIIN